MRNGVQRVIRGFAIIFASLIGVVTPQSHTIAESPPSHYEFIQWLNSKQSTEHRLWKESYGAATLQLERQEKCELDLMYKRQRQDRAAFWAKARSKRREESQRPAYDWVEFFRLQTLEWARLTVKHVAEHRELLKRYRDQRNEIRRRHDDELQQLWKEWDRERAELASLYATKNSDNREAWHRFWDTVRDSNPTVSSPTSCESPVCKAIRLAPFYIEKAKRLEVELGDENLAHEIVAYEWGYEVGNASVVRTLRSILEAGQTVGYGFVDAWVLVRTGKHYKIQPLLLKWGDDTVGILDSIKDVRISVRGAEDKARGRPPNPPPFDPSDKSGQTVPCG